MTVHCFWSCAKAATIWNWVQTIMPQASGDPEQICQLTTSQALIGDPLDDSPVILEKWWAALRFPTLWLIWKARNVETIQGGKGAPIATKRKIWHRTWLYLKAGWKCRKAWMNSGNLMEEEAAYQFSSDYGQNDSLFKIVTMEL